MGESRLRIYKHPLGNYHITAPGYPRFHTGAYINKFVHRVVMARHLQRELTKDEDIHHIDGDKTNFDLSNLQLRNHTVHGWVSAKQHWFMKQKEFRDQKEWEDYYATE